MVEQEQSAEVHRLALALATRQSPDFEAWESLMLQAAHQGGAGVLSTLLVHWQQHAPREVILCRCGQRMSSRGLRGKGLLTTLGRAPWSRSFYQCPQCQTTRFPDDERLDVVGTTYSPGVRRLMARAGGLSNFESAADDLICYARLRIEAREFERVVLFVHFLEGLLIGGLGLMIGLAAGSALAQGMGRMRSFLDPSLATVALS